MTRIFVYGTLRVGIYNYNKYLKGENSFRQYGYVKGSLFTIKNKVYPALTLDGSDMIVGEIHEVNDKTLIDVDKMEGYIGENDITNEYDKIFCDIYNEQEEKIDKLPVYVYNMRNPENKLLLGDKIPCLDYVKYIQDKK